MLKLLSLVFSLAIGFQASAANNTAVSTDLVKSIVASTVKLGPGWVVGDSADYTIKGGFISGTMHMFVREEDPRGMWIQQDMDMGFMGKQKVEILYAPNGEVLELIVNGEKQTPPSAGDQEIVDMQEASVTVPKGTFDCMYVKIKDKKSGDITEAWINMEAIPVSGMIKTLAPSQIGTITVELTDFHKN